jgi:UDP-N-acetylglucosamine 2-epimerase (non-hydrolysing)
MQKIHLIVGARPNFMKMAPLYKEFKKNSDVFDVKLIHTGQHYDERMSKLFFVDLEMPEPNIYLGVGSGSHGIQTAKILELYEKEILIDKPDLVIVAGDVNSTIACAMAAVKLHIPVAHLEAGLRSFDRTMPEEINRLLTDVICNYLLTPSLDGNQHLMNEGIPKEKIHFVGNIMIDSLVQYKDKANKSKILNDLKLKEGSYSLITLHRPSNVDTEEGLKIILNAFNEISKKIKLVFPIHPRTQNNIDKLGMREFVNKIENLILIPPAGYLDFMKLQMNAKFLLTDSGGLQEESTYFGIPCLTLRENTERPITITEGTNKLVKLDTEEIIRESMEIIEGRVKRGKVPEKWDGKTSERIVEIFKQEFGLKK